MSTRKKNDATQVGMGSVTPTPKTQPQVRECANCKVPVALEATYCPACAYSLVPAASAAAVPAAPDTSPPPTTPSSEPASAPLTSDSSPAVSGAIDTSTPVLAIPAAPTPTATAAAPAPTPTPSATPANTAPPTVVVVQPPPAAAPAPSPAAPASTPPPVVPPNPTPKASSGLMWLLLPLIVVVTGGLIWAGIYFHGRKPPAPSSGASASTAAPYLPPGSMNAPSAPTATVTPVKPTVTPSTTAPAVTPPVTPPTAAPASTPPASMAAPVTAAPLAATWQQSSIGRLCSAQAAISLRRTIFCVHDKDMEWFDACHDPPLPVGTPTYPGDKVGVDVADPCLLKVGSICLTSTALRCQVGYRAPPAPEPPAPLAVQPPAQPPCPPPPAAAPRSTSGRKAAPAPRHRTFNGRLARLEGRVDKIEGTVTDHGRRISSGENWMKHWEADLIRLKQQNQAEGRSGVHIPRGSGR